MAWLLPQLQTFHTNTHPRWERWLACAIQNLDKHVGASTPVDIFVFVQWTRVGEVQAQLRSLRPEGWPNVCLLPIPPEQWRQIAGPMVSAESESGVLDIEIWRVENW